ncbi:MAG: PrsW family glutamic-type intramembrane protease [Halobacteriales archaeon]
MAYHANHALANELGVNSTSFLVAASTSEEALKLIAALGLALLARRHETPSYVLAGGLVGLGFALGENVFHLSTAGADVDVALDRAAVAPLHVLTTAAATGAVGLLRERPRYGVALLLVAPSLHVGYNLNAAFDGGAGTALVLFAGGFAAVELLHLHSERVDPTPNASRARPRPTPRRTYATSSPRPSCSTG